MKTEDTTTHPQKTTFIHTDNCWGPYFLEEQIISEFTGLSLSTASLVYIHLLSAYILLSVIFSHLGNLEQHSSWLNTTCRHLINIKPPQTWGLRLHSWSGCGQLQGCRNRMVRVRTCKHSPKQISIIIIWHQVYI